MNESPGEKKLEDQSLSEAAPASGAVAEPDAPVAPAPTEPGSLMTTDLEKEVSAAMASMPAGDLAALTGEGGDETSAVPGAEIVGTVVGTSEDDIFLEFGPKSQGVLPRSQINDADPPAIGSRMAVVVDRIDREAGLVIVRRKGSVQRATWNTLSKGMLVEGRVTGLIKGGLEVDLQGIRGFMPGSQASLGPMRDISVLLNEKIKCEVVEIDRRAKNVVVSRRKILEREQAEAKKKLKAELEVGQTRPGTVKNITDFGAFVDLGGVEGLVHIRDLSWTTVDKVSDVLSVGQQVEVTVLKIDWQRDRLSLGLKQTQPDPWDGAPERYPVHTAMKVRIVRNADFGSFAELEPGVEGLIPVSEMSWTRIRQVSDAVSVGDMVDVVVIRVEPGKRRIALSMKQAQPDPWSVVLEGFEAQSVVKGKVTRLADFGAFVELVPGVEGLIHISELADGRVKTCGDVVKVDQEVEARVLGVDVENRRISLSIKQVKAPEQVAGAAGAEPAPPKKRKKSLRGGLSSHFEW